MLERLGSSWSGGLFFQNFAAEGVKGQILVARCHTKRQNLFPTNFRFAARSGFTLSIVSSITECCKRPRESYHF